MRKVNREPKNVRTGIKWFWIGLAVMFILMIILIGVAVVIRVLVRPQGIPIYRWGIGMGGLLIGLLWLLIFIWIISWIFRSFRYSHMYYHNNRWDRWNHDDAVKILRERYARGEITKEQFDQMMKDLKETKE